MDSLSSIVPYIQVINALPQDTQNLVTQEIYAFMNPYTIDVNKARFIDIAQMAITVNATPALWFSSAGGAVLLILSIMALMDRWPHSGYPSARISDRG